MPDSFFVRPITGGSPPRPLSRYDDDATVNCHFDHIVNRALNRTDGRDTVGRCRGRTDTTQGRLVIWGRAWGLGKPPPCQFSAFTFFADRQPD
jgi:hypothetical protein